MNTKLIVIYNIFGFIGSGGILLSTITKKKSGILKAQTMASVFLFISDLLMKGYSGAVQDFISIVRNLTVIKKFHRKWLTALFIISGLALGIAFNNQGAVGWFPIFANFQFSCLVLWKKADEVMIKLSVCVANVCWAIFNFSLLNYANLAANVVIVTSGIAFIAHELISRKKAEKTEDSVQKARAYRK